MLENDLHGSQQGNDYKHTYNTPYHAANNNSHYGKEWVQLNIAARNIGREDVVFGKLYDDK